jgi:hypothetical protein
MEVAGDELVIRNVEMDIKLGTAVPIYVNDPDRPHRSIIRSCTVLTKDGDEIETMPPNAITLKKAAVTIANYEMLNGYPGFRGGPEGCPNTHRVELLLGRVLADAVSIIARACIEWRNGGLKSETKTKYADLIAQLHDIWYASRFGSFDGESRRIEPYFANTDPDGDPRIPFAAAVQRYGMYELQMRFPELSDETLKEVLSWPLDLLRDTLNRLSRREGPSLTITEISV